MMPTPAEILKARLAKYAQPAAQGVSDAQVKHRVVPGVQQTNSGNDSGGSAPVASPVQSHVSVNTETANNITVQTDLQPTTLVVVERPAVGDSGVSDTARGGDVQGSEASSKLDVTLPHHVDFLQRLADLETALLARDPAMKLHLKRIHEDLHQYEEIVSLLSVEQIAGIMSAQQAHVSVTLRMEVVKSSKAAAAKKVAKVTLDDV